jgi:hypothetical protein
MRSRRIKFLGRRYRIMAQTALEKQQQAEVEKLKAVLKLREKLPENFYPMLDKRDGASDFVRELPRTFAPTSVMDGEPNQDAWTSVAAFYKAQNRLHEALLIYSGLYDHMLVAEEETGKRYHKGTPLVWISDCYGRLGYNLISRRYLMLTLVEDAIRESGKVSPDTTGTYFRLVWGGGLSDTQLKQYAGKIYALYEEKPVEAMYPEWVLQQLDQSWITQVPAPQEVGVYAANARYVRKLLAGLGDGTGKTLELLADYVLSGMPGCRTTRRVYTPSTDLDVVCSMEGFDVDFRSELGRYFVCECKDWGKPANFTSFAKFCRVLDSVKSRFGILFSKQGISGEDENRDVGLEQLKVFQDRGMVIVVIDQSDLEQVANSANFISLLRTKYENVRLNLTKMTDKAF